MALAGDNQETNNKGQKEAEKKEHETVNQILVNDEEDEDDDEELPKVISQLDHGPAHQKPLTANQRQNLISKSIISQPSEIRYDSESAKRDGGVSFVNSSALVGQSTPSSSSSSSSSLVLASSSLQKHLPQDKLIHSNKQARADTLINEEAKEFDEQNRKRIVAKNEAEDLEDGKRPVDNEEGNLSTGSKQKSTTSKLNKYSFEALLNSFRQHKQSQSQQQRQKQSEQPEVEQKTEDEKEAKDSQHQSRAVSISGKELDNPQANDDDDDDVNLSSLGEKAHKSHRLPYYTYHGRARNIALVSAKDRPETASNSNQQRSAEESSDSQASVSLSFSSTRTFNDNFNEAEDNRRRYNPNNQGQYNRTYLTRKQLELRSRGYSNISNLFPDKPMLIGRARTPTTRRALNFSQNLQASSSLSEPETRLKPPFSPSGKKRYPIAATGTTNTNLNKQHNKSRSLINLNQLVVIPKQITNNRKFNIRGSSSVDMMRRHNSLLGGQAIPLGGGPASVGGPGVGTGAGGKMAAGATGGGGAAVSGRPASVSGNYGLAGARTHRRSPSAGSLHYGGTGGAQTDLYHPYGRGVEQDPESPVHGLSAYELDKSGGGPDSGILGSPQEPESAYGYPLYGSRRRGPGYYDGGGRAASDRLGGRQAAYASAYSLYSPTSPIEANPRPAYYDRESRFSVYQSGGGPGGGGGGGANLRDRADSGYKSGIAPVASRLAAPKEQLRRILGYPVPTKPVHLHPQWAYSRPFHHLLPSGAEWTPPSPVGGEAADGGLFIDYDDDINQLNASLLRFSPFNKLEDTQAIRAVDFHPSGQVYAIGSNSRALRICAYPAPSELNSFGASLLAGSHHDSPGVSPSHLQTPQAPRVLFKFLQVHRGSIYCVRFNKTGQLLATGSNDQTVHIVRYNSRTHSPEGDEYRLTMHDGTVRDLCFIDDATSGNSLLLSAGGGDNKIYVTDCDTITPFQSFAGHTGMVMGLHHLGGAQFVSGSQDRTIRFWDLRTRQCTSIVSAPPARPGTRWAGGPGAPVCAVQADHSGRLLVSGHTDSTCMLYDIRGARIIQAFKPHEDEIRTVSFSPKSYYLLTGAYDGRIVLSDLQGDLNQALPSVCVAESDDKIIQSRWHPTDFTFVTTSANKTATLWVPPTDGI